MSITEVPPRELVPGPLGPPRAAAGRPAVSAGFRALFAAAAGFLLTTGLALITWAVTPNSSDGPRQMLQAGVAAFAAGNGMTLTIGRAALTLPPLMITVVAVALLSGISGGSAFASGDRTQEITSMTTAASVYAAVVATVGVTLGTPGAVAADQWWRPALLASVVLGSAMVGRGTAWRAFLSSRVPSWFPTSLRLGLVAVAGVLGAGGVALVVGLTRSFGEATTVQALAAPGAAAGFGMTLLGIAYLPNAVIAGAGYATGVGFSIGGGTYSPFGSSPVEMPAFSLLAAAPDGRELSRYGLLLLLLPVGIGVLVGRGAVRRLASRSDRVTAVSVAAAVCGVALAMLARAAAGGVTGGQWASSGVSAVRLGSAAALAVGAVGAFVAALARVSAPVLDDPRADDETAAPRNSTAGTAADDPVQDAAVGDPVDTGDIAADDLDAVHGGYAPGPSAAADPGPVRGRSAAAHPAAEHAGVSAEDLVAEPAPPVAEVAGAAMPEAPAPTPPAGVGNESDA